MLLHVLIIPFIVCSAKNDRVPLSGLLDLSPQAFKLLLVVLSRFFPTQSKDLRQSALRYVTDNKDVLSDLYKAGGPMELIFEGPENIDIFLMKDKSS